MTKKKAIKSAGIHGLVIFKALESKEDLEETTYSFEKVDQEKKINLSVPF